MSKAVLVMEMPDVCIDCPCHFMFMEDGGEIIVCGAGNRQILTDDIETYKAEWCPLKEIPKKRHHDLPDCRLKVYDSGWNECVDEILKEREKG